MSDLNPNLFLEAGGGEWLVVLASCCQCQGRPRQCLALIKSLIKCLKPPFLKLHRSGFEKGVFANVSMDQDVLCLQAQT